METITTVLLDADGVVQTTGTGWLEELAGLCGVSGKEEEFLQDLFAAEKPSLTGRGDFSASLDGVLTRWESASSAEQALKVWHLIEPQGPVLAQVAALRTQGVRVSLATNQQAQRARHMSRSLGYAELFDDLFYSCELGHAKPEPGYFGAVLERLKQPGSEVLFVDDNASNVDAAREMGMHAEVYDLATGPEGMAVLLAGYGLRIE